MSDKILKLDQAQTLYQDLRGRIDALPTSEDIPEVPVQDVQVNGVSVLQNSVANVPVADGSTLGVVKINNIYGIGRRNDNYILNIKNAELSEIKTGTNYYRPITPQNQEASVFYGLAKIAGHDEKDSELSAGQYTDEAKTAIKEMLGVQDGLKVVRLI